MTTEERIVDTALSLFNEQGTASVSTNHIAEAAGISPGNLYYYFSNKQAIIRALFERLFQRWDIALNLPPGRRPELGDMVMLVRTNFSIMREYQFIYREIIALLRHDPDLHSRYAQVRTRGYEGFHEIFEALVHSGVLNAPADAETVTRLAELCWLISECWLASVEISGRSVDDTRIELGIALMLQVLQPYIRTEPSL